MIPLLLLLDTGTVVGVGTPANVGTVVVTGRARVVPSGVSAPASVGNVQVFGGSADDEVVFAVGVSANASVGLVIVAGYARVPATGIGAPVSVGLVSVSGGAVVHPTGVVANAAVGSVFRSFILITSTSIEVAPMAYSITYGEP